MFIPICQPINSFTYGKNVKRPPTCSMCGSQSHKTGQCPRARPNSSWYTFS